MDLSDLPYYLDADGVLRHKVSGNAGTSGNIYFKGGTYSRRYITQLLTPKPQHKRPERMSIIQYIGSWYVRSKTGDVHSTRYTSKEKAAEAARKMSLGLVHFSPITLQINKANLSNPT